MVQRFRLSTAGLVMAALVLSACGPQDSTPSSSASQQAPKPAAQAECIKDFDPTQDYFPRKTALTDAKLFRVEYHNSYKVVTVPQAGPGSAEATLVLVQCGAPASAIPAQYAGMPTVTVPVGKVASTEPTQIAGLKLLRSLDKLVGIPDADNIGTPEMEEPIKSGKVVSIAVDGKPDAGKITSLKPDLTFGNGQAGEAWVSLAQAKIMVAPDAGAWEATALGRAEWLKYYALFFDEEAKADNYWTTVRGSYLGTRDMLAKKQLTKPWVAAGTVGVDGWQVPGAESYLANVIADAGGSYVFGNDAAGPGTVALSKDRASALAKNADIWLNGNVTRKVWTSRSDLPEGSADFKCVAGNQVWNPSNGVGKNGALEYTVEGGLRPDAVITDLAAIFHPTEFPEQKTYFYKRVS